ncbi:hypothetical protein ABID47_004962 [Paenibacillus favisporus]|uniref:Uncharacterized protein n=1 Tax=Paenibacillus favisporus TaxID=221028 RepID=A0ABV2F997_9BACL
MFALLSLLIRCIYHVHFWKDHHVVRWRGQGLGGNGVEILSWMVYVEKCDYTGLGNTMFFSNGSVVYNQLTTILFTYDNEWRTAP